VVLPSGEEELEGVTTTKATRGTSFGSWLRTSRESLSTHHQPRKQFGLFSIRSTVAMVGKYF
jgi:hypothetical protein